MNNEHCGFCKFVDLENGILTCRRYAPRIFYGSGTGWSDEKFPIMKETDWCGEFQSSPAQQEDGYLFARQECSYTYCPTPNQCTGKCQHPKAGDE